MNRNDIFKIILVTGGALSLVGVVLQYLEQAYAPYIFSVGAFLLIFFHFMSSVKIRKSSDFRVQRLRRLAFLSSTLLAPAAYFMFIDSNYWVVAVFIYAIVNLFLSFRTA